MWSLTPQLVRVLVLLRIYVEAGYGAFLPSEPVRHHEGLQPHTLLTSFLDTDLVASQARRTRSAHAKSPSAAQNEQEQSLADRIDAETSALLKPPSEDSSSVAAEQRGPAQSLADIDGPDDEVSKDGEGEDYTADMTQTREALAKLEEGVTLTGDVFENELKPSRGYVKEKSVAYVDSLQKLHGKFTNVANGVQALGKGLSDMNEQMVNELREGPKRMVEQTDAAFKDVYPTGTAPRSDLAEQSSGKSEAGEHREKAELIVENLDFDQYEKATDDQKEEFKEDLKEKIAAKAGVDKEEVEVELADGKTSASASFLQSAARNHSHATSATNTTHQTRVNPFIESLVEVQGEKHHSDVVQIHPEPSTSENKDQSANAGEASAAHKIEDVVQKMRGAEKELQRKFKDAEPLVEAASSRSDLN